MRHSTSPDLPFADHLSMGLILKFLLLAALGALLIVAQSPGLMIIAALGVVFTFAIQERLRKLQGGQAKQAQPMTDHWVNDGGSFPGQEPEMDRSPGNNARVLDGGSLEHHRR